MKLFSLHEDCRSYDFNIILDICSQSVRYFTLTEHGQRRANKNGKIYKNFLRSLKKFQVYQFYTYEWYRYRKPPIKWYEISKKIGLMKKIRVYQFNEQSTEILQQHLKDIFLGLERWPFDYPEDICFFREDQSLFLGTVSHEAIAEFYLTDREIQDIEIPIDFFENNDREWDCRKVPLNQREKEFTSRTKIMQ